MTRARVTKRVSDSCTGHVFFFVGVLSLRRSAVDLIGHSDELHRRLQREGGAVEQNEFGARTDGQSPGRQTEHVGDVAGRRITQSTQRQQTERPSRSAELGSGSPHAHSRLISVVAELIHQRSALTAVAHLLSSLSSVRAASSALVPQPSTTLRS